MLRGVLRGVLRVCSGCAPGVLRAQPYLWGFFDVLYPERKEYKYSSYRIVLLPVSQTNSGCAPCRLRGVLRACAGRVSGVLREVSKMRHMVAQYSFVDGTEFGFIPSLTSLTMHA